MTYSNGNGRDSESVAERPGILPPEDKAATAERARVVSGIAPLVVAYGDVSLADSGAAIIAADGSAQLVDSAAALIVCDGDVHLTNGGASVIVAKGDVDIKYGGAMTLVAGGDLQVTYGGGAFLLARRDINVTPRPDAKGIVAVIMASRQSHVHGGLIGLVLAGHADLQNSRVLLNLPIGSLTEAVIDAGLGAADWFLGLLEPRRARKA